MSKADRVLVVATANVDESVLRDHVRGSEVLVVAPASRLSPLEWLASDEDEARAEAESIAARSADAAVGNGNGASAKAETGDADPLQAAEDALRQFPADRILVLVRPEDDANWLERVAADSGFERLGLPVTYLVG